MSPAAGSPLAPPRIGGDPELLLEALDPEQRAVATALHGPVAVIAGAGTGKTRAITHRIAYGVAVGAYSPTAVLAVTFTTRAAGEMRGRLQLLGARGVQARTFHSAALRQAQYFWPQAYGGELPSVLDNRMSLVAESASRLRVRVDTARLRDLLGEISWAKVSNTTPEDYPRVATPLGRTVSGTDPETVARIFTGYEELKRQRGRIDFEDILLCTAALLAEHDEIRAQVQRTYRHLVVDEYQDVSPLQHRLLELWRGDRSELCVVGDPAQTIHSFAGARADFLTGFARRHPDATVVRLVRDYRSTPQVVTAANAVMRAGQEQGRSGIDAVTLQAQRPPGPEPLLHDAPDEASEAGAIADWLSGLAARGVAYREMAVLFRINAQSPVVEQALAERGIPYLVRGGERFYERPEVRQAMHALRTQARALTELDPGRSGDAVAEVQAVLEALGWTTKPPEGAGAVRERWESLAALVSVAEDLAAASDQPVGLAAVVAELERRAEAQHVPSAQGVTVSTLHSAKGLEWDAVALFGIQEGSLPFVLATRPEEVAEERRLLYVGLTRAREHLHISWSRSRGGGQATRKPSRFLDPVLPPALRAAGAASTMPRTRKKGTVLSAHCRSCGHALQDAAERKLGRHSDCPATYDERTLSLLKEWRKQEAAEEKVPAFCVFTDATLMAIAEAKPGSEQALIKIPGLGPAKLTKYGEQVLAILAASDTS
ncbi:MAG TPA: ATP-dependent DNA helicase UvrD2 [Microlunatus sp.]|nr:ATP-dependent DNA helicase UvrD2 [Microlunatus sp.]